MNLKSLHIKYLATISFWLIVVIAFGSITGSETEKEQKSSISLKNLNKKASKIYTLGSIGRNYKLSTTQVNFTKFNTNGIEGQTLLKFEKGNTTLQIPYKVKFKSNKFTTPSASKNPIR